MINFLSNTWSVLLAGAIAVGWLLSNWQKTLQIRELHVKLKALQESRTKADSRIYLPTTEEVEKYRLQHQATDQATRIALVITVTMFISALSIGRSMVQQKQEEVNSLKLALAAAREQAGRYEQETLEMRFSSTASIFNGDVQIDLSRREPVGKGRSSRAELTLSTKAARQEVIILFEKDKLVETLPGTFYWGNYQYEVNVDLLDSDTARVMIERLTTPEKKPNVQQ